MPHKFLSILLLALALCACKDKHGFAPIERYQLDGTIVSLDTKGRVARIDGQKIEGWMEGMTMDYPVKNQSDFDALQVGDRITATVFVQDLNFWIGEIHQVR